MAFVVEDGTGISDATSYVAVEYADSYFADRLNTLWTGADAVKQSALIAATDYIEIRFGPQFPGSPKIPTQALSFPRSVSYGFQSALPEPLLRAVCEYALRSLSGHLVLDPQTTNGFMPYVKMRKVDVLEREFALPSSGIGSKFSLYPILPIPDGLMAKLLTAMGYSAGRAIR